MSEDDENAGAFMEEDPANEDSSSQILQAESVDEQNTNTRTPQKRKGTSALKEGRKGRERGRTGLKWVKQNYSGAEQLKQQQSKWYE